jgi:hypothetical protein
LGLAEFSISGGAGFWPTLTKSFVMVEVVLGTNWFGALLAWFARCAFTSGEASSLPSLRRRAVVPNWRFSLVIVLMDDGTGRATRWSIRGADILLYSIL